MLLLWTPILANDNKMTAERAAAYLPDPRASHFWDLWSFGSRVYSQQFSYPSGDIAWDIFVLYKPHIVWKEGAPDPTAWMQNRNLSFGAAYSQSALEAELQKWM